MKEDLSKLATENSNPNSDKIDLCDTFGMLKIINDEDKKVAFAVEEELSNITAAVDLIVAGIKKGGRLFYFGAGTSGRLGVLDASECPPTYGTDPELVQGYIAGGDSALRTSSEGAEDDENKGREEIKCHGIRKNDIVVGITASGRAPYVLGVCKEAKSVGAVSIGLATNANTLLSECVDVCIAPIVGNEVITGSTRMKSGTAQKMVLNMLSTATMVKLGKVYGNKMVDLRATNEKLVDRAVRIITGITNVDSKKAFEYLKLADMDTKVAIYMILGNVNKEEAKIALDKNDGFLRKALEQI